MQRPVSSSSRTDESLRCLSMRTFVGWPSLPMVSATAHSPELLLRAMQSLTSGLTPFMPATMAARPGGGPSFALADGEFADGGAAAQATSNNDAMHARIVT